MKLELILTDYMTWAETNICSVERTRSAVKYLTAELGERDHNKLSPAVLQNYRAKDNLSRASINRELGVLRCALRYALDDKRSVRSIPEIVLRKVAKNAKKRSKLWLREEQLNRVLDAAKKYPVMSAFIQLAWYTGQRKEAILALRKNQVYGNTVWFNDHDLPMSERRKGRGEVPFCKGLVILLDELYQAHPGSPFVLNGQHGSRLKDINREHWDEIMLEAGVPDLTPHNIRHTVATSLIREGVALYDVSKLLGHANVGVTQKEYVDYQPKFLTAAVSKLDSLVTRIPVE